MHPAPNKWGLVSGHSSVLVASEPVVSSEPAMCIPCMCLVGLDCQEGIILGTHHEKGAFTFWSYAIGLPLPSSSILSWKFCHVLHKVLRDGHPNVSVPSQTSLPPARSFWGKHVASLGKAPH